VSDVRVSLEHLRADLHRHPRVADEIVEPVRMSRRAALGRDLHKVPHFSRRDREDARPILNALTALAQARSAQSPRIRSTFTKRAREVSGRIRTSPLLLALRAS